MNQKLIDKGQWWDEGIQLIDGCAPCSPGCDHCWSAEMARRFAKRASRDDLVDEKGKYDGTIAIHPDRLSRFNTRNPKVFSIWNDLFHEAVPWELQYDTYKSIWTHHWNKYIILTKRPHIMEKHVKDISFHLDRNKMFLRDNTYHGLTVCTQAEADEKIPVFLQVPGKKFLCLEPLLGEVDFAEWHNEPCKAVIVGCETGPGRRPCKLEWIESIIDQCDAASVPVFVKAIEIGGNVSKNMMDWPEKFRRRELPWLS